MRNGDQLHAGGGRIAEKKIILYTMEGCKPCKEALKDLADLAGERLTTPIEVVDMERPDAPEGIKAAPCTCVVADGKKPDLNLDCIIGHSPRYKEEIRRRLDG